MRSSTGAADGDRCQDGAAVARYKTPRLSATRLDTRRSASLHPRTPSGEDPPALPRGAAKHQLAAPIGGPFLPAGTGGADQFAGSRNGSPLTVSKNGR